MKRILTAAQMKQADRNTIETMGVPSLVLMERAALSCVEELQNGTWDTGKVLAVCGPGNTGGDGAAIARILKTKGVDAELFCLGNPEKYSEGMRAQKKIAENYGVREVKNPDFREYTVIIDAIFGIGVSRPAFGKSRSRNNSVRPGEILQQGFFRKRLILLPEIRHCFRQGTEKRRTVSFLCHNLYHAGTGCKDCPGTQNSGSAHGTGTGKYQHLSEGSLISHRRAGKKPVQIFFFH